MNLALLPEPHAILCSLLESTDRQSVEFRQNTHQYNMSLAFTSLGVTEDRLVNRHGGWVFRISCELCHLVSALRPADDEVPAFAQLYIYDPQQALQQCMHHNNNLRDDTMASLQSMLLMHHCYAHDFRQAHDILREYPDAPNGEVRLHVMPGQISLQYANPTSDKVAVILPRDGTAQECCDIVLRPRSSDTNLLTRINDGHPAYAPLH